MQFIACRQNPCMRPPQNFAARRTCERAAIRVQPKRYAARGQFRVRARGLQAKTGDLTTAIKFRSCAGTQSSFTLKFPCTRTRRQKIDLGDLSWRAEPIAPPRLRERCRGSATNPFCARPDHLHLRAASPCHCPPDRCRKFREAFGLLNCTCHRNAPLAPVPRATRYRSGGSPGSTHPPILHRRRSPVQRRLHPKVPPPALVVAR